MVSKDKIRMGLAKKMIGCFLLVVLAAAVGFGYIIYVCDKAQAEVNALNKFDVPLLAKMDNIAYNSMAQTAYIRAFFMYGEESYLTQFKEAGLLNERTENEMIELARFEKTKDLIKEIKALDEKYIEIAEKRCVPLVKAGQKEDALKIYREELAPAAKVLLAKIDEGKEARALSITSSLTKTAEDTKAAKTAGVMTAIIVALFGIAIALTAARKITAPIKELQQLMAEASEGNLLVTADSKTNDEIGDLGHSFNQMIAAQLDIVKTIQNSAVELTAASEEMAASTTEVSGATNHIAEDVEDVAAAMEVAAKASSETAQVLIELSSLIQIAREKAESTADTSGFTIKTANDGKATVTAVLESMHTIHAKTKETEKVIMLLNDYSQQIGSINETITGIANQTNLLALNAAIEAARAGEAGRGFAVVAEEVRKLAEQSNAEAGNISEIVTKIMANTGDAVVAMQHSLAEVENGVTAVGKADKALGDILQAVNQIVEKIDEITKVTEDEVASSDKIVELIEEVSGSIEKTEKDTREVAAATEETNATLETLAATSEETSAMAQSLQHHIIKFKV